MASVTATKKTELAAGHSSHDELWIFGYGSLMWRPGFATIECVPARLTGLRRRFCVYSFHHRGTADRPGLVLGLDRGGTCDGVAFKVGSDKTRDVLAYLRQREQVSGVYREALATTALTDGSQRHVKALTYVVERAHPQYAGILPLQQQARIILGARGLSGVNLDYLLSTVAHLRQLGIRERDMERLCALAGPHLSRGNDSSADFQARTRPLAASFARLSCRVRRIEKTSFARFKYRQALGAID